MLDSNLLALTINVDAIVNALIFSLIGLVLFALVWVVIVRVSPIPIRKEIEEDQNTALGIILGSVFIGIALIIAAAVGG
jgi:uncharacterized membrane protein YjfL (UPF0719 family)